MADWHLEDVRRALEGRGWKITELPGDDYRISGTWELRRPRDPRVLCIDFDGLDDMQTLPMDRSYGCNARHLAVTSSGLHFRRARTRDLWRAELTAFVESLEPSESSAK